MAEPSTDAVSQLVAMYERYQQQSYGCSSWAPPSASPHSYYNPIKPMQEINTKADLSRVDYQPGHSTRVSALFRKVKSLAINATNTAPAGSTVHPPSDATTCAIDTSPSPLKPPGSGCPPVPTTPQYHVQQVTAVPKVSAVPALPPSKALLTASSDDHPDYLSLFMAAMGSTGHHAPAAAVAVVAPASTSATAAAAASTASYAETPSTVPTNSSARKSQSTAPDLGILHIGCRPLQEHNSHGVPSAQQLQLNRVQLHHEQQDVAGQLHGMIHDFNSTITTTPQQQLLAPGSSYLAPQGPPAAMGRVNQLLLNQLASAGAHLGSAAALPSVPLDIVHAAAAAATAAAARQQVATSASTVFDGTAPSSPNRHAFRSDGSINTLYKTQICRTWASTGYCKYEERCQFAHGHNDLRGVYRPAKYKTAPCRNLKMFGQCPFGRRCNFIHDGEDDDASPTAASPSAASSTGVGSAAGAGAFSSGVSSKRSSSCEGFGMGSTTAYGSFAGGTTVPNMLVHELQCRQVDMGVSHAGSSISVGAWAVQGLPGLGRPVTDLASIRSSFAGQLPTTMNRLNVTSAIDASRFGAVSGGKGNVGAALAGIGHVGYAGNDLAQMLRMLQLW